MRADAIGSGTRIGLIEQAHALGQADTRGHSGKSPARLVGVAGDGLEEHGAAAQVEFELPRFPFCGADLHAAHPEPAALVEPPEQAKSEIDVVVKVSLEAGEPLHA